MRLARQILCTLSTALLLTGCSLGPQRAEDRYKSLLFEYKQAAREFRYDNRGVNGQALLNSVANDPRRRFARRFIGFAEEHPGTDSAEDALIWVVNNAPNDDLSDKLYAIRELKSHSVKSEKMLNVIPALHFCDDKLALELLAEIVKENPHENVRQLANLLLGEKVLRVNREAASHSLNDAVLQTGAYDVLGQTSSAAVNNVARADLRLLSRLDQRSTAPPLEGENIDGKKIRLSDYKGKVVLISFFGFW